MSYKDLIEAMMKEDGGGMVGPMTAADGNTSISYLPGQFTSMKNMLRSLSTVKKKWNIEVLEGADQYTIKFQDALNIIVPKTAYEEFNTKVLKVHDMLQIDLMPLIFEESDLEANRIMSRARAKLLNLKNEKSFSLALNSNAEWVYVFNDSQIDKTINVPTINLLQYTQSINALSVKIKEIYDEDIGGITTLADALEQQENVGDTELFRGSEWLAASKITSTFGGVTLNLHTNISPSFILDQHIDCDNEEVLNEIASLKTVKVAKDKIYPIQLVFNPGFYDTLKKIIDDVENMQ